MPTAELPSVLVAIRPVQESAGELQTKLRRGDPAVMGRVQEDKLLLDVRTIADAELQPLVEAVRGALCEGKGIK